MFGDSSRSYTWVEPSDIPRESGWRIVRRNYGPSASNHRMELQLDLGGRLFATPDEAIDYAELHLKIDRRRWDRVNKHEPRYAIRNW